MLTLKDQNYLTNLLQENQAYLKTILWKLTKDDESSKEIELKYEELLKKIKIDFNKPTEI